MARKRKHLPKSATLIVVLLLALIGYLAKQGKLPESKSATPPSGYSHNPWTILPVDIQRNFTAFTLSFDGPDDSDGDGDQDEDDKFGVPEWVAYQISRGKPKGKAPSRPSVWSTDDNLFRDGIAPNDDSYKNSDFDRGHLCMK